MIGKLLGFGLLNWLKVAAVAALVAAAGWLALQYNEGQRAIERAEKLEQTLEEERAQAARTLEARTRDLSFQIDMLSRQLSREQARRDAETEQEKIIEQSGPARDVPPLVEDELRRLFP